MRKICTMVICLISFLGLQCPAYSDSDSKAQDILKAVVRIKSVIPEGAESSRTLGTNREGNGVVIDADGTILTVGYLIREAESIEVTALEGRTVGAKFVGYDYNTGFGLLKTDKPLGVAPLQIGKSAAVKDGDPLLIASHGGEDFVQPVRVISRREFAGYWEYLLDEAIYTFPAYASFSGAAIIDAEGKLVGIASLFSQLLIEGVGLIPCNVSIPIDLLNPILADLKKIGRSGAAQRPWLGINAEESHGRIFISRVTSGGPAEKAGLKVGDIMLMVDGKEVTNLADFYRKLWAVGKAGVLVPLTILQGAKIREIKVPSMDRHQRRKTPSKKIIKL